MSDISLSISSDIAESFSSSLFSSSCDELLFNSFSRSAFYNISLLQIQTGAHKPLLVTIVVSTDSMRPQSIEKGVVSNYNTIVDISSFLGVYIYLVDHSP